MTLSYLLHQAGWATATITHDRRHREMRVSYISDALRRMLDAAVELASGAREARLGFTDEPGEHECVVTRIDSNHIRIRAYWYPDWTPPGEDTGETVFDCECDVLDFCRNVFSSCKRLLDEHGEEGYKQRWIAHEFPVEQFEHLSRLLYPPGRTDDT